MSLKTAKRLLAAGVLMAMSPLRAADIATVTVVNTSGSAHTNTSVTFGHVFKEGDVPSVANLGAKIAGVPVDLQIDAKAYHGDSSLRHAVFTVEVPSITASGGTNQVVLYTGGSPVSGAALTKTDLLNSGFDAQISLSGVGTVTLSTLLGGAVDRTWLQGPMVSEFHVSSPVGGHAHLTAYFHIRYYADGRVWIDCIVENGWTQVSGPAKRNYTATINVGGTQVYNAALGHSHHSRWHKTFWWKSGGGGDYGLFGTHDPEYLQATQAVPNYKDVSPSNATLNGLISDVAPLNRGNLRANFGDTGADDSIGPLPLWDALYLTTGDIRALRAVLANGTAGAAYSIHYRDEDTDYPFEIDNGPNVGINDSGSLPSESGGNPYTHDRAHQPSIAYVAYMVSGNYFYLEEMQFWSSWNLMYINSGASYRNGAEGWMHALQVRGQAWALRNLGHAAYITPDSHALKDYFLDKLDNNFDRYESLYANNVNANDLGVLSSYDGYTLFAPWMDDFFTWSMGHMVELGFSRATTMAQWKAQFPKGRMGFTSAEYCYNSAAQYRYVIGTGNSQTQFWPDFRSLYENNISSSVTSKTCGSTAMANALTAADSEGVNYKVGQITGRAYLTDSYYANMQPALAMAVDLGVADLSVEWARWIGSGVATPVTPSYDNAPTWAVEPRALTGPTVTFTAAAVNIDPGDSTQLNWSTSGAVSCTASGAWSGAKAVSGSQTVTPAATSTYSLRCLDGSDNGSTRSVTVMVGGITGGGSGGSSSGGGSGSSGGGSSGGDIGHTGEDDESTELSNSGGGAFGPLGLLLLWLPLRRRRQHR